MVSFTKASKKSNLIPVIEETISTKPSMVFVTASTATPVSNHACIAPKIFSAPLAKAYTTSVYTFDKGTNAALTPFKTGIRATNTRLNASYEGVANISPILEKAALTFFKAPEKVLFASVACFPNASSMAFAKVLKSTLPFVTIVRSCASLTPYTLASSAATLRPRLAN